MCAANRNGWDTDGIWWETVSWCLFEAFFIPFLLCCLPLLQCLHSRIWCQCISHSSEECLCSADCPPPHPWASSALPLCKSRCDQLETSYYFITRCSLLSAVETIHIKVFHPAGSWVCPKLRPSMITLVKMLTAQSVLIRAHLDDCVIVSFAMPGDLALKSTAIETFFYGMKPRYPAGRGYDLYQNQTLVGKLGVFFILYPPTLAQNVNFLLFPSYLFRFLEHSGRSGHQMSAHVTRCHRFAKVV